jgi:hypothetical protein
MMRLAVQPTHVPEPILRKLRGVIRRYRAVVAARGSLAVLATLTVSLLTVMALDAWLCPFSAWARWTMSLSALAATLVVAGVFLVRPLARVLTLRGIARSLEVKHPELQERISSAIELLDSPDGPDVRGSEAMIAVLAREASANVEGVIPQREVTLRSVRAYLVASVAAMVLLASVLVLWPEHSARLLARAVAPYANLGTLRAEDMTIRPGDTSVPIRTRLRVEAVVRNRAVTSGELHLAGPDGRIRSRLPLSRVHVSGGEDWPRFAVTCPPATSAFRYRLLAGGGASRWYDVEVVTPPDLRRLDLRYRYPSYAGLDEREDVDAEGDIVALGGTEVRVRAVANKPLAEAWLEVDGLRIDARPEQGRGGRVWIAILPVPEQAETAWTLHLRDRHGFENEPAPWRLEAIADRSPSLRVTLPKRRTMTLPPEDRLAVRYVAADDLGFSDVSLLINAGREESTLPQEIDEPNRTDDGVLLAGGTSVALAEVAGSASRLTLRVRVADTLPPEQGGPQETLSDAYTIVIKRDATPFVEQVMLEEELRIRKALEEVLAILREVRKETRPLPKDLRRIRELSERVRRRLDGCAGRLGDADGKVRTLAQAVRTGPYGGLAGELDALSGQHVSVAESYIGRIGLLTRRKRRAELAEKADYHVDRSIQIVEELLAKLGDMTELAIRLQKIDEMSWEQEDLALDKLEKQLAEAGEEVDAPELSDEDWKKRQAEMAEDIGEMASEDHDAGAMRELLDRQAERSRSLDELAGDLADRQKDIAEQTEQLDKDAREVDQLAKAQRDIADDAARSADEAQREAGKAADDARRAEKQAAQAGEQARVARREADTAGEQAERADAQAGKAESAARSAEQTVEDKKGDEADKARQSAKEARQAAQSAREQAGKASAQADEARKRAEDASAKAEQAGEQAKKSREEARGAEARASAARESAASAEQAAKELEQGKLARAVAEQKQAEEAFDKQGQAGLERRQQDVRRKTEQLAKARQAEGERQADEQLDRLRKTQKRLAREADELADKVRATAPQGDDLPTEAAISARKAASELDRGDVDEAAREAGESERRLASLARRLQAEAMGRSVDEPEAGDAGQPGDAHDDPPGQQAGDDPGSAPTGDDADSRTPGASETGEGEQADPKGTSEATDEAPSGGEQASGGKPESSDAQVSGKPEGSKDEQVAVSPAPGRASTGMPGERRIEAGRLAGQAEELSKAQARVRRELEAMSRGKSGEAVEARQEGVSEETEQIARAVADLAEQARDLELDRQVARDAAKADEALSEARASQQAAAEASSKGDAGSAAQKRHAAARQLSSAARALSSLSRRLAQEASQAPAAEGGQAEAMAEDLAGAYEEAQEASKSGEAMDAASAAAKLASAAMRAMARAREMGLDPAMIPGLARGTQGRAMIQPGSIPPGKLPVDLEDLGLSPDDWARLPGKLRGEILQSADEDVPESYRQYVRRYFRALARRRLEGADATEEGR